MFRDIGDRFGRSVELTPTAAVLARRIEDQLPQQLPVDSHDPDVAVSDEQHDRLAAVPRAKTDVVQARVVAEVTLPLRSTVS